MDLVRCRKVRAVEEFVKATLVPDLVRSGSGAVKVSKSSQEVGVFPAHGMSSRSVRLDNNNSPKSNVVIFPGERFRSAKGSRRNTNIPVHTMQIPLYVIAFIVDDEDNGRDLAMYHSQQLLSSELA